MASTAQSGGDVVLCQASDGTVTLDVRLSQNTVWLNQQQMAELFGRERSAITKHIRNTFRESELDETSNVQNLHIAGSDKPVGFYSFDVVISVGYRVKSLRGTQFRIWATSVLRDHIVKGYSVNANRLRDRNQVVRLIADTARRRDPSGDEAKALLAVVGEYNQALGLLDDYDHQRVVRPPSTGRVSHPLGYEEALRIVEHLRSRLSPWEVFGVEKDKGLASAVGVIMQTFDGQELYPGLDEKAAHLLYFLVKNHAFVDGKKRIVAALFMWFLGRNGTLPKDEAHRACQTPRLSR